MKAKVSIIVPVYKTEKYLSRCVESLRNQNLNDIEIILVDDGSPDNCPALCDHFERMDHRIKAIHKKNGGLSSARNAGIAVATGDYIGFVDSDDTVETNMFDKLYTTICWENVDFIMTDYLRIYADGHSKKVSKNLRSGKFTKKQIQKEIYPQLIMRSNIEYGPLLSVWHCLYKRDFLINNQLLFDEEIRWSEDNIFSALVGYNAESFYYLKGEYLYHYYQNEGTITTSYRKGAWDVYQLMNDHLRAYFYDCNEFDFAQQLKWHMLYYACNCISQTVYLDSIQRKRQISFICNSKSLARAFSNVDLRQVENKLKLQLMLMKYKQATILSWIIMRRNKRA